MNDDGKLVQDECWSRPCVNDERSDDELYWIKKKLRRFLVDFGPQERFSVLRIF